MIATFIILKVISIFVSLRMDEATLKVGDDAVHGETAYAIGVEGEYPHPLPCGRWPLASQGSRLFCRARTHGGPHRGRLFYGAGHTLAHHFRSLISCKRTALSRGGHISRTSFPSNVCHRGVL